MADKDDLQSYIERLGDGVVGSEEIEDGMWVLSLEGGEGQIVVSYAPPVVVFRVNVMELPADDEQRNALMRTLLELNATELVHGSYGIEGNSVVLTDALQLDNLAFSEFQASIDSLTLALGSHLSRLALYQE